MWWGLIKEGRTRRNQSRADEREMRPRAEKGGKVGRCSLRMTRGKFSQVGTSRSGRLKNICRGEGIQQSERTEYARKAKSPWPDVSLD